MPIPNLPDDVLLLILQLLDLSEFHARSAVLYPLLPLALYLVYSLVYANLRLADTDHVALFLAHVRRRLAAPAAGEEATCLAGTRRLMLCLRDRLSPSAYADNCLHSLFSLLPRLKVFKALEAFSSRDLTALNQACGKTLESLELVLASDSLDRPTISSFSTLARLKSLSVTFYGRGRDVRIEFTDLGVLLPQVTYLKIMFIEWHCSALAFFSALTFPSLHFLSLSDTDVTSHPVLQAFFSRHRAALEILDMETRPEPICAWSFEALHTFSSLKKLTLRWVPDPGFCSQIPAALEELCLPLFYCRGRHTIRTTEMASYAKQWNFLDILRARAPRALKKLSGRNVYVGPYSTLLDWTKLLDHGDLVVVRRFMLLAAALEQKNIEFLDWKGERSPRNARWSTEISIANQGESNQPRRVVVLRYSK
ncbi:hypothetical protein DACRYDRAFT_17246 [Dacryopinax primogenitus]|uniref:F-box domain-containing protein n=1 Tax=Dacryopinax primogenitus (strain DJM 731) TaxID=1858805 RepID=M5FVD7_DACPD|nr:uncharacterized protein DACRYDRAFT_17246 [Dacryopinax primogenitus]EJT99574.1 hypothetical protein DACRYDRAFT_17246 [Dacryopinax primogenitus]